MENNNLTNLYDLKDRLLGNKGTKTRDSYEKELLSDIDKHILLDAISNPKSPNDYLKESLELFLNKTCIYQK